MGMKEKTAVAFYIPGHVAAADDDTSALSSAYSASRCKGSGGSVELVELVLGHKIKKGLGARGDWLSLPCRSEIVAELGFVTGGTTSIKVLGMDGTVISANGMEEIQKLGKEAFVLWEQLVPACVDLGSLYVLRSNSEPRRGEAMAILSKLMENIASDPDNVKYRQISRLNRKIKDQLLSANGAIGVLRSVGFREHGDMLVMPMAASLMALNRFRNAIRSMHENTPDSVSLPVPEEDSTSSQPSIMCPICFTSLSDILSKGSSLVSTVCGHLFCSWCLPSCLLASPKCPTCRVSCSVRDYHPVFLQ